MAYRLPHTAQPSMARWLVARTGRRRDKGGSPLRRRLWRRLFTLRPRLLGRCPLSWRHIAGTRGRRHISRAHLGRSVTGRRRRHITASRLRLNVMAALLWPPRLRPWDLPLVARTVTRPGLWHPVAHDTHMNDGVVQLAVHHQIKRSARSTRILDELRGADTALSSDFGNQITLANAGQLRRAPRDHGVDNNTPHMNVGMTDRS